MNQHDHKHQPPALGGRRLMPAREYKRVMGDPSEMKLWRDEQRGVGPMPVRQNGRRYWFADEVFAYLDRLAATRRERGEGTSDEAETGHVAATCTTEGAKGG